MTDNTQPPLPPYVTRSREVQDIELNHYLKQHREANGIKEEPTRENLSGICISGGGVRSATLGLGMFQAFIKAKKLKYFDYLSTVSGGGYIGACLSSLLSAEPERRDKHWNIKPEEEIINRNTKFKVADYGLDEQNSPFTNEPYEYPKLEDAKLNTRHQLIHLRQHGEYLTPHKSIRDWDVHRLIGALFGGVVTNVSTFILLLTVVVLMHHLLLAVMSGDQFIETLRKPAETVNLLIDEQLAPAYRSAETLQEVQALDERKQSMHYLPMNEAFPDSVWRNMSASAQLNAWATHKFAPQLALVWVGLWCHWELAAIFGGLGFLMAYLFLLYARSIPYQVARQEQEEQNYNGTAPNNRVYERKSDQDMLDLMEQPLIKKFYHLGLWAIPLAAYVISAFVFYQLDGKFNYFVMLALPLCYSVGLYSGLHLLIYAYFINHGRERVSGWMYRSFYTGMQGGALLMMLITTLFPIAMILLFGDHGLAVRLSFSFVPVMVAYYFTMQSLGARVGGNSFLSNLAQRLQTPMLNLSIYLFIGLAFAWVSEGLINIEHYVLYHFTPYHPDEYPHARTILVGIMFLLSLAGLILLGFIVNANDVSLHYFYRDRLSEAYLRTVGRVEVKNKESLGGKNLQRVTLRNHEDLKLKNLGEGNFKAPYHLIVTALNLQGSHDLSAKTQKSEHFIFSKFFIGSRSTGYAGTSHYYRGDTKLSTAMTISAAAVSAGMGPIGFAASNFYMTLFNLRTGYWIDNPKHFIKRKALEDRRKAAESNPGTTAKPKKWVAWTKFDALKLWWENWTNTHPFWLRYVGKELTGNLSASSQKVYVSDGGHTGDNLGLLPLIQRQCSTIVVADFEEDGTYAFESFNQAVRLAKSIYNADINVDLHKLMPVKSESGAIYSPASVVEGIVTYNVMEESLNSEGVLERKFSKKTGRLIYMKSTVSILKGAEELYDENAAPPPVAEPAPVFVLNYFKKNPNFPHHSTADQYFDEIQFEAYRMLGEHIGKQAAGKIKFEPLQAV